MTILAFELHEWEFGGRCYKEDTLPINDMNILTMSAKQCNEAENEKDLLQGHWELARFGTIADPIPM